MTKNYYQILGVSKMADQQKIKAAFKKLALQYHPDKNPGSEWAEVRFKEINNAYQTLSDPEKKAQYDLLSSYQQYQANYSSPSYTHTSRYPPEKKFYRRNKYSKQALEKNNIANRWAMGILAGITLTYFILALVSAQIEKYAQERLAAEDLAIIENANEKFKAGIFNEAINILDNYMSENGNRDQIQHKRRKYLEEMMMEGNFAFAKRDYLEALRYYKIIFQYQENLPIEFYKKVALCSKQVGNFSDAVEAYSYMARKLPENLDARLEAALIYTYNLKDYEKAVVYYNEAKALTIKSYIETYGKAFVLVFDPLEIPDKHYLLYSGLGLAQFKIAAYQGAIESLQWAQLLRPNRPEAYYINGLLQQELGDDQLACRAWSKAAELGLEDAGKLVQLNCGKN